MIQRRGLGTVDTTDAFITTATMAFVTNWVLLPCRSGLGVFEACARCEVEIKIAPQGV